MKKCIVFIFVMLSLHAISQEEAEQNKFPETFQEFFMSEAVFAQEKAEFQITGTYSYFANKLITLNSPAIELEYGITDRFQISAGIPYYLFNNDLLGKTIGFGNSDLGLLYNLINKQKYAFSVMCEVGLPTGSDEVAEDELSFEPHAVFATQLGVAQIHFGLGGEIGDEQSVNFNIAGAVPFQKFVGTLELNSVFENDNSFYITPGLIFKPIGIMELGVGVPVKLVGDTYDYGIIFGLTFEFGIDE